MKLVGGLFEEGRAEVPLNAPIDLIVRGMPGERLAGVIDSERAVCRGFG